MLIPAYGWKSLFVVGVAVPILLALVVLATLPEPLRFMVQRMWLSGRIAAVLRRIAPGGVPRDARFVLSEEQGADRDASMGALLSRQLRTGTLMLWLKPISSARLPTTC
jgi:AAHS family 4-hydroxybenzoate transporter-like MFS transporter